MRTGWVAADACVKTARLGPTSPASAAVTADPVTARADSGHGAVKTPGAARGSASPVIRPLQAHWDHAPLMAAVPSRPTGWKRIARRWRRAAATLLLVAWTAVPAWAQPKTDVVTLPEWRPHHRGDPGPCPRPGSSSRRMTSAPSTSDGTTRSRSNRSGSSRSRRQTDAVFSERSREGAGGFLTVVGADGSTTLTLAEVTGMAAIGRAWTQLEGSFSAGFSYRSRAAWRRSTWTVTCSGVRRSWCDSSDPAR